MKEQLKILFVGNSYTYYNDMPTQAFVREAESAGYRVTVTAVTKGGAYLSQFADPEHEQGGILRQQIAEQHYDFAVLQDQSLDPIVDEARFLAGVRGVQSLIDADHFVLYATWGRNEGNEKLAELGLTRAEMTEGLSRAYRRAAELYGMQVAEVGRAFLEFPERDALYVEDGSHPSALGSAIAARVIWQTVRSQIAAP